MHLGWGIAGVFEVVGAFIWRKCSKDLADRRANVVNGARGNLTQQVLELGKDLFDGVQVGRIFRQEDQLGAGRADEPANDFTLVAAEIVHDDDVAGMKRGDEDLFDIGPEALPVDRTVE